jgi:hypothetical protein
MNLDWMLARLAEPSTWRGLTAVLAAAGVAIRPDLWQEITTAGIAIAGAIEIIRKEGIQAAKNLIVIGLAGSALLLGGCTSSASNLADTVKALAGDSADVCGIATGSGAGLYQGEIGFCRVNMAGSSASIDKSSAINIDATKAAKP